MTLADDAIVWNWSPGWSGGSGDDSPSARVYAGLATRTARGTMAGPNVVYFCEAGAASRHLPTQRAGAGRAGALGV